MRNYSVSLGATVDLSRQVLDERVQGSARDFVLNVWPQSIDKGDDAKHAAIRLANQVVAHIDSHLWDKSAILSDSQAYTDNQAIFLLELIRSGFFEIAENNFMSNLEEMYS
jgi:alkylhydroperoxidase family enzyme